MKAEDEFAPTCSYCRPCWNEYRREYRKRRPDVDKRARDKWRASLSDEARGAYKRRYSLARIGTTVEKWDALFAKQGGRCAICRTNESGNGGWHTDHDHACCPEQKRRWCGKCLRSILCSRCNMGLGLFRDNPEFMRTAADYIDQWQGAMN